MYVQWNLKYTYTTSGKVLEEIFFVAVNWVILALTAKRRTRAKLNSWKHWAKKGMQHVFQTVVFFSTILMLEIITQDIFTCFRSPEYTAFSTQLKTFAMNKSKLINDSSLPLFLFVLASFSFFASSLRTSWPPKLCDSQLSCRHCR